MTEVYRINSNEEAHIQRFLYVAAVSTVLFAALIITAIVTANDWLTLISPESERRFVEPYIELAGQQVLKPVDTEIQRYVEELGHSLAERTDVPEGLELEFIVIKSEETNAYSTLGGYILVTTALFEYTPDENSLAMIIAHEIAHAIHRDPLLTTGRGMLIALLISALSGQSGSSMDIADTTSELMISAYSREHESRADLTALAILNARYGHIGGSTTFFRQLSAEQSEEEQSTIPDWISTHPDLQQRIDAIHTKADQQGWHHSKTTPYPDHLRIL